jgi:hypothetical protein
LAEVIVRGARRRRIGDPLLAVHEEGIAVDTGVYRS